MLIQAEPADAFDFITNLKAIPPANRAITLLLLVVGGVVIALNTWLGGFIYNDIDRLSSTPFNAASINRDLGWLSKMEITQGTQNLPGLTGTVPLVTNRQTVVRVWGNQLIGRPVNAPEAIL